MENKTAVFGGGCFWCLEAVFSRLKGVKEAVSGYAGGHKDDPAYRGYYEQAGYSVSGDLDTPMFDR